MSHPGKHWFHITYSTHGSWLPGDPRGFRSRHEKVHSSGDHRNPPPHGEHIKLLRHIMQLQPNAVVIPKPLLAVIGNTIVIHAKQLDHRLNALSIAPTHAHLLIELPRKEATVEVGKIKRRASWAVRDEMPGKIWAKGCGIKPIRDKAHQVNTYNYIIRHRSQCAWVWSFKDDVT